MTSHLFISKRRKSTLFVFVTFLLAFVVIMLGAYTRLTNAGLSCPDWPHCYGFMTAPHTSTQIADAALKYPATPVDVKKAWTEMTHRYFAGTEGILVLILAFTILIKNKARSFKASLTALSLIVLLCIQVLLGMLTVTEKLKPVIVLLHLLTGISLLSVLWFTYLNLKMRFDLFKRPQLRITSWLLLALLIVAIQITLGGWVSTHYAGLACIDFPYCNGKLLPPLQWNALNTDLITIHMLHRIGALITAIYLIGLAIYMWRDRFFRPFSFWLIALVILQITLGILNIVWLRPVFIALFHQTVAILLLLTVITLLVKATFTADSEYDTWFS